MGLSPRVTTMSLGSFESSDHCTLIRAAVVEERQLVHQKRTCYQFRARWLPSPYLSPRFSHRRCRVTIAQPIVRELPRLHNATVATLQTQRRRLAHATRLSVYGQAMQTPTERLRRPIRVLEAGRSLRTYLMRCVASSALTCVSSSLRVSPTTR